MIMYIVDELDLAYAITIHKSQGSEFKVVIIPAFMGSAFLMNRNLLYTGITRAKELVVVVGIQKALKYMVDNTNSMERYSSLKERIIDIVSDDKISEELDKWSSDTMNYKELSNTFKKINKWYAKKTKVLTVKTRPFNTMKFF